MFFLLFLSAPELGFIYEYKKDMEQAVLNYLKLLELNHQYLPTYLNLSRIYKNQGDLKKAQMYLEDALSIKDDFAPAANNLAMLLLENNVSLYEALRYAKVARNKEPKNPDYLDTLGWIYFLQGSHDIALQELTDSVKIRPDNPEAQYHLGWAYYDDQQYENARKHMKLALELDPNFKGSEKAKELIGE